MIPNNIRADVFRQRIEDKNDLKAVYYVHYGTGIESNGVYETKADNIVNVVNKALNCTSGDQATRGFAYGNGATSLSEYCTAIGNGAVAGGKDTLQDSSCTAIGYNATAATEDGLWAATGCIAIGAYSNFGSTAPKQNSCVIGNKRYGAGSFYFYNKTLISDTSSDIRLKEEIKKANTQICLEDVNKLPVVRFKYKDFVVENSEYDDRHVTGFLADDVEKVFPKAVRVAKGITKYQKKDEKGNPLYKKDADGNDVPDEIELENVKHINMGSIGVATLWGAVQELSKQLEAANNRIKALEEKVNR